MRTFSCLVFSLLLSGLSCLFTFQAFAQDPDEPMSEAIEVDDLMGHWRGVYKQDRGTLAIRLNIQQNEDGDLIAVQSVPDWIGYADFDPVSVSIDGDGTVRIPDALYGGLVLQFDPVYRQLVGTNSRDQTVHLVRALPEPIRDYPVQEVEIETGEVTLAGTLSLPDGDGPHPAMIVISGRGCWGRGRGTGRVMPAFGIAVLEYDKRGTGRSTGDCETATFSNLVEDAVAVMEWMRSDPRIKADQVGLQGGSAGAWTAQGVAERALDEEALNLPAFIITYIGPATSIEQQQREAGDAIAASLGLSEDDTASISRAVDVILDRSLDNETVFQTLTEIANNAEEAGWKDSLFDSSDIPDSADAVDRLWLRRFSFDPQPVLTRLSDTPYLSLLGEDDAIVPLPSNSDALRDALDEAGNERYRIVVIPGTGHGTEHGDRSPTLPDGSTYFKFDTVEPLYFTETIDFLREEGFLPR